MVAAIGGVALALRMAAAIKLMTTRASLPSATNALIALLDLYAGSMISQKTKVKFGFVVSIPRAAKAKLRTREASRLYLLPLRTKELCIAIWLSKR